MGAFKLRNNERTPKMTTVTTKIEALAKHLDVDLEDIGATLHPPSNQKLKT